MTGNSKWRIVTDRRSKAYDHFYVNLKDNNPTNRRKCVKCWQISQNKSTTSTSMMNYWEKCSTKEKKNPKQPDIVSAIQIQPTSLTLNEFLRSGHVKNDSFDISEHLPNFKPASVDAEHLFSLARISKTDLQARMLPETLARYFFRQTHHCFQGTQIITGKLILSCEITHQYNN